MEDGAASHDTSRLGTSLYNPYFKVDKPDVRTSELRLPILLHQLTFSGTPHIWIGGKTGRWSNYDPDSRKPFKYGVIRGMKKKSRTLVIRTRRARPSAFVLLQNPDFPA